MRVLITPYREIRETSFDIRCEDDNKSVASNLTVESAKEIIDTLHDFLKMVAE